MLDISVSFFRNFFEGGGAQNLSLPPGASYPRYATEYVEYEDIKSKSASITTGVPEGSILGPLITISYIHCILMISLLSVINLK